MNCPNCGHSDDSSAEQCRVCGQSVQTNLVLSTTTASVSLGTTGAATGAVRSNATDISIPQSPAVPAVTVSTFRPLVMYYVAVLFFLCVFVLGIARGFALHDGGFHPVPLVALLAATLLAAKLVRVWNFTPWIEDGLAFIGGRIRLLVKSSFMALTFLLVAAIFGYVVGHSGAEQKQLEADIEEEAKLGKAISDARESAANTFEAQIEMYATIAPDVERLQNLLNRLRPEWIAYRTRFPTAIKDINQRIDEVEVGSKQVVLLKQQIEVARQMRERGSLGQALLWQDRMVPLLKQEDALGPPAK